MVRRSALLPQEGKLVAAQKGNQTWKLRKTHGDKPKYKNPDDLWKDCCGYFEWCEANPLVEEKLFVYQGEVTRANVYKMRAMTMVGLCLYLGISRFTWDKWRKKDDLAEVTSRVDMVMYEQKFTGAAAEFFNVNIIARELGLSDKQDVAHSGDVTITKITREIVDPKN